MYIRLSNWLTHKCTSMECMSVLSILKIYSDILICLTQLVLTQVCMTIETVPLSPQILSSSVVCLCFSTAFFTILGVSEMNK